MIKFFRQIRNRYFSENRFSGYLLYAIGEIILVMIGILLALQVNNWNENRKNEQEQIVFLNNLKRDLSNDLEQLNKIIFYQTEKLALIEELKAELITTKNFAKIEELFNKNQNTSNFTFFANTGSYTTAISSGALAKLQPDSLKIAITNLYERFYHRLSYNGEVYDKRNDEIGFERGKYYDKLNRKLTAPTVIEDNEFLNLIAILLYDNGNYVELSNQTKDEILKVDKLITFRLDP
ncbi:MAG: DUF6090 family protein [Flavobacteriaceae bacterium]|nr:DUF6090 family protein [Flavobacteriaceae bacterium]